MLHCLLVVSFDVLQKSGVVFKVSELSKQKYHPVLSHVLYPSYISDQRIKDIHSLHKYIGENANLIEMFHSITM